MRTIHLLPSDIIAKIAAGEVIERPAYAVKELVENSLDAGATSIDIHLTDYGLKKIIVHDNGEGMSKEDLTESFKLHTTSKIDETHSLLGIASMGFRGEALASIASMSDMMLQSRTCDDTVGTSITLKAGKIVVQTSVGMPVGTSIIIENLFYATPGRKKFLKSDRTELRHIIEQTIYQTIAHHNVSFTLTHNKKQLFTLSASKTFTERVPFLFSKKILSSSIPIEKKDAYFSVYGLITQPQFSLTASNKQYIFINHRHVTDTFINQTIKQAYGSLLPKQRFPGFILFIDLPFEMVDVNVHPRKEQVSIRNKEQLGIFLQQAIRELLATYVPPDSQPSGLFTFSDDDMTHSVAGNMLREEVSPWLVRDSEQEKPFSEPIQIQNMYIVMPNNAGVMLIDQHAAHERILYEQYRSSFTKNSHKYNMFKLNKPILIDLTIEEKIALEDNEQIFKSMGFAFAKRNDDYYIVAIPVLFQDRNIEQLIKEILETFLQQELPLPHHATRRATTLIKAGMTNIDAQSEQTIKYLACRQAIKAGDSLNINEMKRLLDQLEKTKNNLTCPHGRPTKIQVNMEELHKVFRRK